jgi:RNA polymerase sigma-70 factor (ECF subfamily)
MGQRRVTAVDADHLETYRPLLFSIAYRMLGEVGDAEDVVQEAFLRAYRPTLDGTKIPDPRAFLTEVATRLAIDHLRSARVRRERYVGPWVPDPLVGFEPDVAVFLLHDGFGFAFEEIARIVSSARRATAGRGAG